MDLSRGAWAAHIKQCGQLNNTLRRESAALTRFSPGKKGIQAAHMKQCYCSTKPRMAANGANPLDRLDEWRWYSLRLWKESNPRLQPGLKPSSCPTKRAHSIRFPNKSVGCTYRGNASHGG